MSGARRQGAAIAGIVLAAAVVFGPALVTGEVFTVRDHTDYFQPMRLFTSAELRAGHLPLWNPYNASGEPWLANPQTAVFYPPAWIFLILPFATAYVAYLLLHSLLLGGGTYALLRRHHSEGAAVAAAAGLMLAGPVLSLLDVSNNFTTFAWVPLILWRGEKDRDAPGSWRSAAVLLGMAFLAGEPFFAAIAALLYSVVVRRPRTIAAVAAGSVGLVAVQLLPFVEMLLQSDRVGGFSKQDILRDSMSAADYLRIALPPALASRVRAPGEEFIAVPYVGFLICALAIAGVWSLARGGNRGRALGWTSLAAVALFVASGPTWIAHLPLTLFRYPARLLPFAALAIVALAAAGWDRLRRGSAVVDAVLIVALVVDLAVAVHPLLVSAPFRANAVPYPAEVGRNSKIMRFGDEGFVKRSTREAWVAGYLNLLDRRFDAWTPAPATLREYAKLYARASRDPNVLRSISVGYVLSERTLPAPFEAIGRFGSVIVHRLEPMLPLVYVRSAGLIVGPRHVELGVSRVRVIVAPPRAGRLVLTQNDAPGWRAFIDGKEVEKRGAFGRLCALDVTRGTHEILWIYRPLSLRAGAVVTLLTLLWMTAGAYVAKRARRVRT